MARDIVCVMIAGSGMPGMIIIEENL